MVISSNKNSTKYSPTTDAGLGLVYRLNSLWAKADIRCIAGDFDGWNFLLDRIYCNLSYREKLELIENKNGQIISVKTSEKNAEVYKIFKDKIKRAKNNFYIAMKTRNANKVARAREEHYSILMDKDMWLRKFMADLGIYMKEYEYNPATALFGGG